MMTVKEDTIDEESYTEFLKEELYEASLENKEMLDLIIKIAEGVPNAQQLAKDFLATC